MIFIDSSALISYFVSSDINSSKVQDLFNKIVKEDLVTSQEVIVETLNWLVRKANKKTVIELGEILLKEDITRIIQTEKSDK